MEDIGEASKNFRKERHDSLTKGSEREMAKVDGFGLKRKRICHVIFFFVMFVEFWHLSNITFRLCVGSFRPVNSERYVRS